MRAAGEFLGMALFIGIGIWLAMIWWVPQTEKPVAACRPIAAAAGGVRNALTAFAPGGDVEKFATFASNKVNTSCLGYTANLFAVVGGH